jgi:hypothetical protein
VTFCASINIKNFNESGYEAPELTTNVLVNNISVKGQKLFKPMPDGQKKSTNTHQDG